MKQVLFALLFASALHAAPALPASQEEEISLDSLGKDSAVPAPAVPVSQGAQPGTKEIDVIVAVDMTAERFDGEKKSTETFSSNHEYVVLGLHPEPRVSFLIEIVGLTYWEFQYFASANTLLKFGKIAVPFGPMFLHSLLGGVVGKPRDGGGETALMLPLEWTEYGAAWEQRLVDRYTWSLKSNFWITNGLSGRANPERQTVDITEGAGKVRDNNQDKAVGLRLENRFLGKYGLNFSFYTCKWANDDPEDTKARFYEGDRIVLGNADIELGYGFLPWPVLRNLRLRAEGALMRTHSTERTAAQDLRVPWHNKTASLVELTYNGMHRFCDLRLRAGTYDDNTGILNSHDLANFNVGLTFYPLKSLQIIPMYMWNRERVNETKDDFFFIKFFIQI